MAFVSSLTGILSKSIKIPVLEHSATSQTAPNMPPSVTSCKAVAPICFAILDSLITDKKPRMDFAFSNKCGSIFSDNMFSYSLARMTVPSKPAHFVIMTSCPTFAPPVAIKLFLSVPKATFIIAIDNQVMKYSIENKYPKITEDSEDFSDSYIEKIIQLPISIPELSETDIKNYLLLLICELFLSKGVPSTKENQLDILLAKVKETNVFVNGIKIDLEFVRSAFKQYDYTILDKGTIDEFEKMFDIIGKTSDVIASILKGNPRQAKRFLNSFLIRKSLAEIYYKTDRTFDYAILAKLMTLEYIDMSRFKELYKWAIENQKNSKIKELETITNISRNDEELPEEYRKWSDEKLVRWLKSDPIDIYEKDLLKYFYLTRESLDINVSVSDSLGKAELTIFNKILQSKRTTEYSRLIKKLKENKDIKYVKILDALIEEFKKNSKLLEKMQPLYICYSEYRSDIKDVLKKMKIEEINLQKATALCSMYQADKSGFSDVIGSWKDKGLAQDVLDVITQEK